jgi:hypothetical protein
MITGIGVARIVAYVLAMLLVAAFVHAYGLLQMSTLQHAHRMATKILPLPTWFYYHYAWLGYVLPIAAAAMLFIRSEEQEKRLLTIEIISKTLGLIALAWLLGCIIAWQLPYYIPIVVIK